MLQVSRTRSPVRWGWKRWGFAAAAVHAGALGEGNEWLAEKASRKIPIYLVVGTRDPFFPLSTVRATRDTLADADLPVELVEMAGHDHDYYRKAKLINAEAWAFLSGHQLSEEPVYEPRSFY